MEENCDMAMVEGEEEKREEEKRGREERGREERGREERERRGRKRIAWRHGFGNIWEHLDMV